MSTTDAARKLWLMKLDIRDFRRIDKLSLDVTDADGNPLDLNLTQRRRGAKAQKGKEKGRRSPLSHFRSSERRFFASLRLCAFALKIRNLSRITRIRRVLREKAAL